MPVDTRTPSPIHETLDFAEGRAALGPAEPLDAVEAESRVFTITHVKAAPRHGGNPHGAGRPARRILLVNDTTLRTLLDVLPPSDRIILPSGEELACRGGTPTAQVDALVPIMTREDLAVEVHRRANMAMIDDMAAMRRGAMEATTIAMRNGTELLQILGKQADILQANLERTVEMMDKQAERNAERDQGDTTDKVLSAVLSMLNGGDNGGMRDIIKARLLGGK